MMVDPYQFGALNKEHHERLVADLEGYARDAGIQPVSIMRGLPEHITKTERDYLTAFRRNASKGVYGLVVTGENDNGLAEAHLAAMCGALVRNFIRAKVMTLGALIDMLPKQEVPDTACLLIPNFFLSASEGGTIATWQVNSLFDYLVYRQVLGLQTILYASDVSLLGKEYGMAFKRHLDVHFLQAKI